MSLLPIILLMFIAGAAALLSARLLPLAIRRAVRGRFLDRPDDGRKDHTRSTPPIGGLVIVPLFLLLAPIMGLSPLHDPSLFCALLLLLLVGVLDDRFEMPAVIKLAAQIGAALLVVLCGDTLVTQLGHLLGTNDVWHTGPWAVLFTTAALVFLINAMNMIDGVDGLLGGLSVIMLFWLGLAALMSNVAWLAAPIALLLGLVAGFLVHNMRYPGHARATVFMGDTGSMALGLLVAYFAVQVSQAPQPGLPPIGVAMVILVPIIDTFALFFARVRSRRGPFTPGRDHLHHRLLDRGFTPGQVTVILMLIMLVTGGIGVFGAAIGLGEATQSVAWLMILVGYTLYLLRRAPMIYRLQS